MMLIYTTGYFFEKNRDIKIIKKKTDKTTVKMSTVKDLKDNEIVIAYTTLKECKLSEHDKDNNYLLVDGVSFEVFEKKKKLRRTVGYIPVGDNKFIGVQKTNLLPIILLPLILLLLLSLAFCGKNEKEPPKVWNPNYEESTNQGEDEQTTAEQRNIPIFCFTTMQVDKETGKAKVSLRNLEESLWDFEFAIFLENGTILYKTNLVAPGNKITDITLYTTLEEGTYTGYVFVQPYMIGTGEKTDNMNFKIDIVVS